MSSQINVVRVVCPHCGQNCEIEGLENSDLITCPTCEQVFEVTRNIPLPKTPPIPPPPVPPALPQVPPSIPGQTRLQLCPFCKEEIAVGAIKCKHCGEMLKQKSTAFGGGLIMAGLFLGAIGGLIFLIGITVDTTVSTGNGERVHNIGLLQQQQLLILIGIAGGIAGGALTLLGWVKIR